ncbi:TonB-dependent receptor plug domain-containing protein [Duganella sp. FT80W]|uniref:TonB-dependent receptor plug domain-containing protein n=1 Tax=Duganella guangzhouensis TaxID=2666084 RepID=A0A6I2KTT4_9BURK|nr:TonB-dependent receptor [Duganella guangzhouensis]MRW88750.1 TonB-dependent receptor plug domain-containing protein [Duganella guangzhouensis]
MPIRLTQIAAAVAALSFVAHARAEVEQPKQEEVQKVEIKGSAAKYDARRDDTASKTVVSAEEIQKYGDTSVNDVLKRLPGITVGGAAGRSGGEVRMRGLGAGYTQILINGERAPAGFSIDTLAPDVIERIEVLRAASAEFSTQSIAGTINIVLKKALKPAQRELKLSESKSSHGSSPSMSLQMSDRSGTTSYSFGGNAWRFMYDRITPSWENGTDADGVPNLARASTWQDAGRGDGFNLSPRINWALDGGDTLTSQSFFNFNRFASSSHSRTDTAFGAGPDYDRIDSTYSNHNGFGRTDLNWVHKLEEGAKLDLKAAVSDARNSADSLQIGGNDGLSATLLRTVHSESEEQGFSTQGKYTTPFVFGTPSQGQEATEHALSLGWDAGLTQRDDTRVQRDADLPGSTPVNSDEGFNAKVTRLALYGQDEWNITPLWSVYTGLRWEGLDTRADGGSIDPVQNRSSVFSPLMQTLIKLPNKKDQFRLALTRTYKAPTTAALIPRKFTSTNNSPTDPDRRGNPDLKPELALGLDASFEHYWGDGGLLSASASVRRIENYTHQGLFYQDQRWVQTAINDGNAETRGIELEAKFPASALIDHAPKLDLRASVSRNWSRVDSVPGPDNRLDQQVPLSATLGIDYKTPDGQFSTGSNFSFRNGGLARISGTQGGYTSVRRDLDVYALWKLDPQNNLRVAVSNLLAQDYTTESLYNDANGSLNRTTVASGETQLRVTVERRF